MAEEVEQIEMWCVLVRVSPAFPNLEKKLQRYFQLRRKSGGGECSVKTGPEEGTYLVFFEEREACECVMSKKEHSLEFDDSTVKIYVKPYDKLKPLNFEESSEAAEMNSLLQPQEDATERQLQEVCHQNSADSLSRKIFLHITARLNTNLFTKDQREQIRTLCPNLKRVKASTDLGIEEISGDFTEMDKVHQYLETLCMEKRESSSRSERRSSLSSKEGEIEINVDVALYDYVTHVCQKEINELQVKYNVRFKSYISGDCCIVRIVEREGNNNASKARERFISIYQKTIENLAQVKVPLSASKRQRSEMTESLNAKFPRVLAKVQENELILLGPKNELPQAEMYLERVNVGESWLAKPVRITQKDYIWEKGIEIDASQIFLLENVLAKEIEAINHKYDSELTKEKSIFSNSKVNIRFRPKNKDSELYLCAYESFISAFQRIMTSLVKESYPIRPAEQEQKLKLFFDRLQQENQNVALDYGRGTLTVTGLPQHVSAAVAQVARFVNEGAQGQSTDVQPQAAAAKSDSEEPMEVEGTDGFTMVSLPSTAKLKSEAVTGEEKESTCPICLDKLEEKVVLSKCKHEFCKGCIKEAMDRKPVCPVCNTCYGVVMGNQPVGSMSVTTISTRLPGHNCDTININYTFPSGIQTENHPNPGKQYYGTTRQAYLPNSKEGREILKLLTKAFDQKLIFTVGQSRTSGSSDVITWNDIHHKTNIYGGPEGYGYPDPEYLKRVREELKAKGIE